MACSRLYVLGGKDASNARVATVETLDPREPHWAAADPLPAPRSSFGCAQLGGQLYAVGGNEASGLTTASVACYCPLMQRWRDCADLLWPVTSPGTCTA